MRQRKHGPQFLLLSELKIDPEVQRNLRESRVNYLIAHWDEDAGHLLHPLVVTDRDGWYAVNDGQHRVAAMLEMFPGDKRVSCIVRADTGLADEAWTFSKKNNYLGVQAFDRFRLLLRAGDEDAVAIMHVLVKAGLRLEMTEKPGAFAAVTAAQRIYKKDITGDLLLESLTIPLKAWGKNHDSVQGFIVEGVARLVATYPELDRARLVKKMSSLSGGASKLIGNGRTLREALGGTVVSGIAEALRRLYNTGLRTNRLGE